MFPSRFTNLPASRALFGDRVDRLGAYLTRTDPVADAAAASLDAIPGGAGWQVFRRIANGDDVGEAPAALRAFFDAISRVPVWVDWELVHRGGQLLLRAGWLGGLVLGLKSLVLAYASPAGNKPLVLSGRLVEQAASRLNETARFVGATIAADGLRPHAPGWRVTLKVRLIHARVRHMILRSGRWDADAWGAPINQHDEAGTLLLFSVAVLEGLRQLGLRVASDEAEAYMHLWRWSGWLMGIDPELLPATENEGKRLAKIIEATQGRPDDDSRALTRALLESPLHGRDRGVVGNTTREGTDREAPRTEGSAQAHGPARATRVGASLCRTLIGDAMADALGVPHTRWQRVVPVVRQLVWCADLARQRVPGVADFGLREGRRYWDRVAAVGFADATAEFAVPEHLHPRASMASHARVASISS